MSTPYVSKFFTINISFILNLIQYTLTKKQIILKNKAACLIIFKFHCNF